MIIYNINANTIHNTNLIIRLLTVRAKRGIIENRFRVLELNWMCKIPDETETVDWFSH